MSVGVISSNYMVPQPVEVDLATVLMQAAKERLELLFPRIDWSKLKMEIYMMDWLVKMKPSWEPELFLFVFTWLYLFTLMLFVFT